MDRIRGSVLVLHPDDGVRHAVAEALVAHHFSVGTAADTLQAIERFAWPGVPDVLVVGGLLREPPLRSFLETLPVRPVLGDMLVVVGSYDLPPPGITHRFLGSAPLPAELAHLVALVAFGCERRRLGRPLWEPLGARPGAIPLHPT